MKITKTKKFLMSICLMLTSMGNACDSPYSDFDLTSETPRASLTATGTATGEVEVKASFQTNLGFVNESLSASESLTAVVTPVVGSRMTQSLVDGGPSLIGPTYESEFAGNAKDTLVEITFDRSATEGVVADRSETTLPSPFELDWVESLVTLEPVPLAFSRSSAEPRYVTWWPSSAPDFEKGDTLHYDVRGECIEQLEGEINWRKGKDALSLTRVLRDREDAPGDTCTIEVTITLRRRGVLDPYFSGGRFVGQQARSLYLLSRP